MTKCVFKKFKRVINWKKFKNESKRKKKTFYNCDTKGHFVKKCHQNKINLEEQTQRFFTNGPQQAKLNFL
jgi:cytoplasmic iron level regulating protein YaaA (DUF328/UPF0246 family)